MEQFLSRPLPLANLGTVEWVVILVVVLLLFGARKLPALAESMGASISSFKKGMKQAQESEGAAEPKSASRAVEHDAAKH